MTHQENPNKNNKLSPPWLKSLLHRNDNATHHAHHSILSQTLISFRNKKGHQVAPMWREVKRAAFKYIPKFSFNFKICYNQIFCWKYSQMDSLNLQQIWWCDAEWRSRILSWYRPAEDGGCKTEPSADRPWGEIRYILWFQREVA